MTAAIVLKAYAWDPFVERQARRCKQACGAADFFVALDETNGPLGEIPLENVFRFDSDSIVALGFSPRFEEGSIFWWNADYPHYAFRDAYPDYDFYVFVEYDADIRGSYEDLVARATAAAADVVTLPIKVPPPRWRWTLPHRQTYAREELSGALVCISAFSRRALDVLAYRRREMTAAAASVAFWPSAEVFVPTEAQRAGLVVSSLSHFGDVSRYDAFPPMPEESLPPPSLDGKLAFFHPVLDDDRRVASLLRSSRFVDFLMAGSQFYRALTSAVQRPSPMAVFRAGMRRLVEASRVRRRLLSIRLFGNLADGLSRPSGSGPRVGVRGPAIPARK